MLIVSKCLTGAPCRYDGGDSLVPELRALAEAGEALAVCPEQLGGLPTPRVPAEKLPDGRVLNRLGEDVTAAFARGAARAAALCRGCSGAVLKARSPSCGCGEICDGSFTGARVPGNGVFAQALLDAGVPVMTDEDYRDAGGVRLELIGPENWRPGLRVSERQRDFVSDGYRLLARAYAYREHRSRAFLICREAEPVGMALVYDGPEPGVCDLSQLFIDERFQRRGYGLAAAKLILAELERSGRCDRAVLCCIEGNEAARAFWEKLGFVPTGERDGNEILMEKRLGGRRADGGGPI